MEIALRAAAVLAAVIALGCGSTTPAPSSSGGSAGDSGARSDSDSGAGPIDQAPTDTPSAETGPDDSAAADAGPADSEPDRDEASDVAVNGDGDGDASGGSGGAVADAQPSDADGSTGTGGAQMDAGAETVTTGTGGGMPEVSSAGDGDRTIGPSFASDPLTTLRPGVPASLAFNFTMALADSAYYTGAGQSGAVTNRTVSVRIPRQYDPAKPAALMVTQDALGTGYLPAVIDNLIASKELPVMVSLYIQNGGGDSVGSERGLEYDTVSGLYAAFVMREVVPLVIFEAKAQLNIDLNITDDPNGHATMGGDSGGAAAFSMLWWHPDLFRRMIAFSPTLVAQVPAASPFPHGGWVYHDIDPYDPAAPNGLVVANCEPATGFVGDSSPAICDTPLSKTGCEAVPGCRWNTTDNRPIRVWLQSSQFDLGAGGAPAGYRNDDLASHRLAAALNSRGYHYHYDYAAGAGHNDASVQRQTIVEAMRWIWRGYPIQ